MWWSANALNSFSSFFINTHTLKLKTLGNTFFFSFNPKVRSKFLSNIWSTCSKRDLQKQCKNLWRVPKFHAPPFVYFPKLTQQNKIVFGDIKYNSNSSEFCNFSWRLQKRMIQQRNVFKNLEYDDNYCSHWRKDNMTQHQKMLSRKISIHIFQPILKGNISLYFW